MTYIILGANGFIGNNLYNTFLKHKFNAIALKKDQFDLTNEQTYTKFDFENTTILDCIAYTDLRNKYEINRVNVLGLKKFVTYLKTKHKNFKYIYFSTLSTLHMNQILKNDYIKSKFEAEKFIKSSLSSYQIIRLTFPVGEGENKARLISRIVSDIVNGKELVINNVTLNLTPIEYLNENLLDLLKDTSTEINFTDGKVYQLKDIVDCLYEMLNKKPNYKYHKDHRDHLEINHLTEISKIDSKILKYGVLK